MATRTEIFQRDLAAAHPIENLVMEQLQKKHWDFIFKNVSENPEFYYKGDIAARDLLSDFGATYYIDVKNDSRIAETGNILCEEYVINEWGARTKGNMFSNYDYIAIHSGQDKTIYVLDFSILKERYKEGYYKEIPHYQEGTITECYLVPLGTAKSWGALKEVLKY